MIPEFNDNQCFLIKNKEEFEVFYPRMWSASRIPYEDWIDKYNPGFPLYLEWGESVTRGRCLGIIHRPIGTWSGNPLKVLQF